MSAVLLLGVPAQLTTVLNRLTAQRAANLDEINATRMAKIDTIATRTDVNTSTRSTQTSVDSVQADTTTLKSTTAATNSGVNSLLGRLTAPRGDNLDLIPELPGGTSPVGLIGAPFAQAANGVVVSNSLTMATVASNSAVLAAGASNSDNNWVAAGSITGKGILQHLSVFFAENGTNHTKGVRITIDGVVLYEVSYTSTLGQSDTLIFPLVGGIEFTATSVDVLLENTGMLPFRESVLVETSASAAVERGAFLGGHLIG